ncbi:MAG: hypothetical protein EOP22_12360 [Hyphomicrobiales bacterium]|nr:MAG: hypothetical protein EOP22_12360 [Hyphomicrobiales bacterium]
MRSLIFAASLLLTAPALATEWIHCSDAADQASVGLLLGGEDFTDILAITLSAGEAAWSSAEVYGPGEDVSVAQADLGDDRVMVDLADVNDRVIAGLRVSIAEEGDDYVKGGTLRIAGQGAWVVECVGP